MRDFKADFPIFAQDKTVYIDNAATAQRPACVLDAERNFYLTHNANPLRGLYALSVAATEDVEAAREAVRAFIGARHAEEIIFTRNTTESLNLVAYSYGRSQIHAGDEVLVSITERTREIGTRKALGAPASAIRMQFITESVILCLIGGFIGIVLGLALGTVLSNVVGYAAKPSIAAILIAVGFSMAIGVFFGYYPANKAAKLDPIEALRYE